MKRIDVNKLKSMLSELSDSEIERRNKREIERSHAISNEFKCFYNRNICYTCKNSFDTFNIEEPCIHWLLGIPPFKAKHFPKIYGKFNYGSISSFLRLVANQEHFQGNINDMSSEQDSEKVFQATIVWKNIEWSFDCSKSDYTGHGGKSLAKFPHYHFQMRIDRKRFIDFNQHHLPFSESDLFVLDLYQKDQDLFTYTHGVGGAGMQDLLDIAPELIVKNSNLSKNPETAPIRMRTFAKSNDGPIDTDAVRSATEESRRTGMPVANLLPKYIGNTATVKTIISPADSIPDIAKRKRRK